MPLDSAARVFEDLERHRIVPVVSIENEAHLDALAGGLALAGLPIVEITLRSAYAHRAIARASSTHALRVGAGSVLTVDDAKATADAGASFIVSPGLHSGVVDWCLDNGMPVLPGVATATEVLAAREMGLRTLKFFPASVIGGAAWLAAIAGPIPDMRFVATGGIDAASAPGFLARPNLLAVGGSWFLPKGASSRDPEATATGVRDALAALTNPLTR
ncbi:bifunctional 4-hydroxy-2-oxoglutarate aldolase/2-dehydro-3-deoxy-phosphogluconate aldolase [Agrococcus sp. KRD186]|uniref:bifunctional 4-hydroxy-2-oxoglutarate aldolase/2-dehydro-3-deoxy-phosphogluconate aldolase n=1 Tax=Agrococcus sp. KRD186 TaxID=2729730 RepID=UPI0019D2CD93|nr:bifunctional 4-hydroxy-2-oxoglutarate aldolase/2-dehydro-3-deoxy-phosphogluconate aldolase [Agrococcus sp. KRD186]